MGEIVEAYVNPDLPPEEWTGQLRKVKEFIYLLEDLTPDQVQGLAWRNSLLQEQLRNAYDLKKRDRTATSGAMREADFFILQTDTSAGAPSGDGCLCESVGLRLRSERPSH